MTARIPWSQGKTQGILRISPFLRKSFSKTSADSGDWDEFPTQTEQGIFLSAQGINSRSRDSQGISRETDPRTPTHPMRVKYFNIVDMKVLNNMAACADEHAWLLRAGRASDAHVEPRIIKSADEHWPN